MADDKNIILDLYPLHEEERAAAPGAFLLSLTEAKRIMKAAQAMFPVLHKYLYVDDEELKAPNIQSQLREEIITAFTNKRIKRETLIKACEKVRHGKYWTYYLTQIGANPAEGVYTVESNVPGIGEKNAITPDKYPAFYEGNPTIAEIAAIIGIPSGVLYVPEVELRESKTLYNALVAPRKFSEDEEKTCILAKSDPIIDSMSSIRKNSFDNVRTLEGFNGDIFEITAENGVKIRIDREKYDRLALTSPSADKLKTLLENASLMNDYKDENFCIPFEHYMTALGLKDRKEAAKKANVDIDTLGNISINAKDVEGIAYTGIFHLVSGIEYKSGKGRKGSIIVGKWSPYYLDHLRNVKQIVKYHPAIFTIPNNKRNEYSIAKAFCLHKRINAGKPGNIENRLRVSKLLSYSKLPDYDSLENKSQASQKIIEPFVKALDYLEEHGVFTYRFTYRANAGKGDTLTEEDLYAMYTDYFLFSSLVVEVKWTPEPDYSKLKERKQKQIAKASEAPRRKRGRPRKNPIKETG